MYKQNLNLSTYAGFTYTIVSFFSFLPKLFHDSINCLFLFIHPLFFRFILVCLNVVSKLKEFTLKLLLTCAAMSSSWSSKYIAS